MELNIRGRLLYSLNIFSDNFVTNNLFFNTCKDLLLYYFFFLLNKTPYIVTFFILF
ncbi:Hypothetical protein Tcol_1386 [Trichococcus collinsii]|uniref:Uncharacterized protein n=1 Tax=Trichococcus collinsii TaxID=157076 RepID=A0AB38A1Q5_9LACT|nr:Hypothetical protein Tcol_1386 [Trichococcus collinsii]SEA67891.1 hypothetical protein SAMN04488525_104168 [Trichococcus collinsii]